MEPIKEFQKKYLNSLSDLKNKIIKDNNKLNTEESKFHNNNNEDTSSNIKIFENNSLNRDKAKNKRIKYKLDKNNENSKMEKK